MSDGFLPFDLGCNISELVNDGFPNPGITIRSGFPSSNGYSVGSRFSVSKNGDALGKVKPELEIKSLGLTLGGMLDTNNKAKLGISVSDLGLENSALDVNVTQFLDLVKKTSSTDLTGNWKYQTESYGMKLGGSFDVEQQKDMTLSAGLVLQRPAGMYWSLNGKLFSYLGEKNVPATGFNAKGLVGYVTNSSEANFSVKYKQESDQVTVAANWYQRLYQNVTYGVLFKSTVSNSQGSDNNTSAVVVGKYELDEKTTFHAKTTTTAVESMKPQLRFGLGLTQRVFPSCHLILGVDLNAHHLFNSGSSEGPSHSLAFEVNLS